jgi:hypothetical protein
LSARSDAPSVTLWRLPAMVHWPLACVTVTAGAPHCSRGSYWAAAIRGKASRSVNRMVIARSRMTLSLRLYRWRRRRGAPALHVAPVRRGEPAGGRRGDRSASGTTWWAASTSTLR